MKSKEKRYTIIDSLRGLSIVAMIFLHTNAYFLSGNRGIFLVWNLLQFAVPVFVFCSAYVFFKKNYSFDSALNFFSYIKGRFTRLISPYLIFVIIMFGLIFLKEPQKINTKFVLSVLFLKGGIDINWLVLLFLYLTILMPFIFFSYGNFRILFYLYGIASLASSVILLGFGNSPNYRLTMWLPWTTLIILALIFVKKEGGKIFFLKGAVISLAVLMISALYLFLTHRSISMFDNKYPPNIYHISYGVFAIFIFYWLSKKGAFDYKPIRTTLEFLSVNSFSLFFIHYVIIYILTMFVKYKFNWISFFLSVFFMSTTIQFLINTYKKTIVFLYYKAVRLFGYLRVRAD